MKHIIRKYGLLLLYCGLVITLLFLVIRYISAENWRSGIFKYDFPNACKKVSIINAGEQSPCTGAVVPYEFLSDAGFYKSAFTECSNQLKILDEKYENYIGNLDKLTDTFFMKLEKSGWKSGQPDWWKYVVGFGVGVGFGIGIFYLIEK